MTTGEEGLGLREAELGADLTRHRRPGGVLGAQEWRSQGVKSNRGVQERRSGQVKDIEQQAGDVCDTVAVFSQLGVSLRRTDAL